MRRQAGVGQGRMGWMLPNYRRVYEAAMVTAAFPHLNLRGLHDLATPSRTGWRTSAFPRGVIDKLMGHHGPDGRVRSRSWPLPAGPP